MIKIRAVVATAALMIGIAACDRPIDNVDVAASEATAEDSSKSQLSAAEQDAGWKLLFDGLDTDGWKGYQSESVPSKWIVDDGTLHFDPDAAGAGGDIMTEAKFEDFEFVFEWRISECGNSGVIYRAIDTSAYEQAYMTGPEYQVLDNTCHDGPNQTASNYDMHPATEDVTRAPGEWNEGRIVVDSAHVEHWLNGRKVVEYELWTPKWDSLKAGSKWSAFPDYGAAREGHIALQDHTDPVWYRRLRIRGIH